VSSPPGLSISKANGWSFTHGETPLIAAISCRRLDVVKLLLKAPDLAIDAVDSRKETALMAAASVGWDEAALLLLRAGAGRWLRNTAGLTAADLAGARGRLALQALIEADPAVVHVHDAAAAGKHQLVLALLRQGCPPNFRDERPGKSAMSPLMAACKAGQIDVVRILLRLPDVLAEVNMCDQAGLTALHHAAAAGFTDVTFLLMSNGADRAVKDLQGLTPQNLAARHGFGTLVAFLGQQILA